nr:hypothetical protein GCM10020063_016450 [Dactylosporangium thailandense]
MRVAVDPERAQVHGHPARRETRGERGQGHAADRVQERASCPANAARGATGVRRATVTASQGVMLQGYG